MPLVLSILFVKKKGVTNADNLERERDLMLFLWLLGVYSQSSHTTNWLAC